jgi:hypothetical protein
MGKTFTVVSILIIILLLIGGLWFFVFKEKPTQEVIICNVGHSRITPIPEGRTAGGQITGIETHSFKNGETLDLCCSDASTLEEDLQYKSCTRSENNVITHEILWKKENGELTKVKEFEPEFGATCTYYFDPDGSISSRMCA